MREICYRGLKNVLGTSTWIYGYGAIDNEILTLDFAKGILRIECDKGTIGQYTGQHDRNGKEVYEGDIVHCYGIGNNADEEYNAEVVFSEEKAAFVLDAGGDLFSFAEMSELCDIEVIGNISDNPELQEGVK
jgi:uncharacterized phage protein (TIGR01671 family)